MMGTTSKIMLLPGRPTSPWRCICGFTARSEFATHCITTCPQPSTGKPTEKNRTLEKSVREQSEDRKLFDPDYLAKALGSTSTWCAFPPRNCLYVCSEVGTNAES